MLTARSPRPAPLSRLPGRAVPPAGRGGRAPLAAALALAMALPLAAALDEPPASCRGWYQPPTPPPRSVEVQVGGGGQVRAQSLEVGPERMRAEGLWLHSEPFVVEARGVTVIAQQRSQGLNLRDVQVHLLDSRAQGVASRATLREDEGLVLEGLQLDFCKGRENGGPGWGLQAGSLRLDEEYLIAEQVRLVLAGIKLPRLPSLRIRRDSGGASGMLVPSLRLGGERGLDVAIPWHWALAGNMDLTLTGRVAEGIGAAGTELEYRYMTRNMTGSLHALGMTSDEGDWSWMQWQHQIHKRGLRLDLNWAEGERLHLLHRHTPSSLPLNLWQSQQPRRLDLEMALGGGFDLRLRHQGFLALSDQLAEPPRLTRAALELLSSGAGAHLSWRGRLAWAELDHSRLPKFGDGSATLTQEQASALHQVRRTNLDLWGRYRQEWGWGGWSAQLSSRFLDYSLGGFESSEDTRRIYDYGDQHDTRLWAKTWLSMRSRNWKLQPWLATALAEDENTSDFPGTSRLRHLGDVYDLPDGEAGDDSIAQRSPQGAGVSLARTAPDGWRMQLEASVGRGGSSLLHLWLGPPGGWLQLYLREERGALRDGRRELARTARLQLGLEDLVFTSLAYEQGLGERVLTPRGDMQSGDWRDLVWKLRVPLSEFRALEAEVSRSLLHNESLLQELRFQLGNCCLELDLGIRRTVRPNYNPDEPDVHTYEDEGLSLRLNLRY